MSTLSDLIRRLPVPASILVALVAMGNADIAPRGVVRTGSVLTVLAGGDFQAALNAARSGDSIVLQAGATYTGQFHLPRKSGDAWITILSSSVGGRRFPAAGIRARLSDESAMAKILGPAGSALTTDPGAHHYRFVGLEIAPTPGTFLYNVIEFGSGGQSLDDVPHHLVLERCYVHGSPEKGSRRGIALNSADTDVTDSYFADFKEVGADSQAIAGWNGPGPFRIVNNFLQGAGENVLFGGADPSIPDLVPSDIEIRRNTFSKPVQWHVGDPAYQGVPWTVKNLLELKSARRVQIEGNLLENNWVHAQNGFAILFTVRNQDGNAPWSVIEDVTFTNNVVRHVAAGVNILGRDDIHSSQQTRRITIRNNLFLDVGGTFAGNGRLFQLLNGTADVTIDHNVGVQTDVMVFVGDTAPHTGFVFTNNIAPHNQYGIIGGGTGVGRVSIDRYLPGSTIRRNVMAGGNSSLYPEDNFFPSTMNDVRFVDSANGNFRLATNSSVRGRGTDNKDVGVDQTAIAAAMAGKNRMTADPGVKIFEWPNSSFELTARPTPSRAMPPTAFCRCFATSSD